MYLDPGFGSMFIQGIVAVLAAGSAYLILIRKKIAALIRSKRKAETPTDHGENDTGIEK